MTLASILSFGSRAWQVVVGPRRIAAAAWACGSLFSLLPWAYIGLYAQAQWQERRVPNNLPMHMAKVLGVTVMCLEATYEYPNRWETERLVMFYDRLDRPRQDAEAMDQHLARMEAMLGGSLRAKVYWVRGRLRRLGQSGLSTHGLALGSDESPASWEEGGNLDKHELAHAALDQYRAHAADPAYFLHEGWARSQMGLGPAALARGAWDFRDGNPSLGVRDMISPDWYHRDAGPVYPLGGAFVDFLIREYGVLRFVRLYNEGKPETFLASCRDIFGADFDALEEAFWKDAEKQIAEHGANPGR
jgi:hypothetical protein